MIFHRIQMIIFSAVLMLGMAASNPALAIQNIGFPDDQSVNATAGDAKKFQSARAAMLNALRTIAKYDGVEGESKQLDAAMRTFGSNAQIAMGIAKKAGNKDVAHFMSTLKSWSTSGDADDRPAALVKKIDTALRRLQVKVK